ncbi:hypothetical protein JX265_000694 [Neoarthrinium moseri]|uniref:Major facilitator superfamily (MFS) profile domain-containing protein n=1 Tax=Neoarthrinium moseri TaxID=1658444 RepID=A0A9Q0AV54_9PEZI|nr:uncharacterized protein JN550_001557 [Neoarthrinium moseri]KAI1854286.1 hypothetical protein JX266_001427 [Neoarthrinium moseri]KAI1876061.1 hypothetical protein JN550_001557 [Neoarthrinium moseri]KAI1881868.1 hypothetical protein JX265_000694 [Neoarthrinium moseri]
MDEKHHGVAQPPSVPISEEARDASSLEKGDAAVPANINPQMFVVQDEKETAPVEGNTSDSSSPQTLLGNETYPEGGREAWTVVFGSFCGLFASLGIMNMIAIFQTYTAAHQLSDYSEGTIGWIFSVYTFLAFGCGIYIGPIFDKYGPRWLILPGGIGIIISMMLMSICTQYWHFLLVFGILNGVCTSLLFTPCFTTVGHFFKERRGTATGLASTGGGVGGVIFPLMLNQLFPRLGWGWSVRILGFICLFLVVICNLLVHRRLPPAQNASPHPDFRIFRDRAFLLTTAGVFLLEFALFIPLAYISSYALAAGFPPSFSFTILTILNAASILGRCLPGLLADVIGPFNSNIISVFITVVACLGVWLPAGHTLPGIIIFAILFGFATGNNISITPVCVSRLCHISNYGRYYATCYTVVSIACLIGIPIGGAVLSACGGDYWGLILLTGLVEVLSLIAFIAAKVVSVGWKPWVKF